MAIRLAVMFEDDLEGGPADETVQFGIGSTEYEIDLNTKNARMFRVQLAPFVGYARKADRGEPHRPRPASSRRRSADIRAWARKQGIQMSDRGRIRANVIEQYRAATQAR